MFIFTFMISLTGGSNTHCQGKSLNQTVICKSIQLHVGNISFKNTLQYTNTIVHVQVKAKKTKANIYF